MNAISRIGRVLAALALLMPVVYAHEGHDHDVVAAPASQSRADASTPGLRGMRLGTGDVILPKPAQYRLAIRTRVLRDANEARALTLPAEAIPDPAHSARVASTERGILTPPPQGFLRIGQRVARGTLLAYVEPLLDEADIIRRRAELAQTEQELVINEQGLAQLGKQIENQVSIATTSIYHKNMLNDRARLEAKLRAVRRSLTGKVALRAPVAGEITLARTQTGALVEGGELIYEILDPERVWVEATSFDRIEPAEIERAEGHARSGARLPLRYMGQGLAATDQAFPLEFDAGAGRSQLRVGERLAVRLYLGNAREGLVLPRASVTRTADGETRVWVQTGAERFSARPVRVEPISDDRVLVAAGLKAGDRVVIDGGWLLDQIR